jgi:hypothetical protein
MRAVPLSIRTTEHQVLTRWRPGESHVRTPTLFFQPSADAVISDIKEDKPEAAAPGGGCTKFSI